MNATRRSGRFQVSMRPGMSPAIVAPNEAAGAPPTGAPPTYSPSLDFTDTRNSQYAVIVSGFI
jgi:hypothetical protein